MACAALRPPMMMMSGLARTMASIDTSLKLACSGSAGRPPAMRIHSPIIERPPSMRRRLAPPVRCSTLGFCASLRLASRRRTKRRLPSNSALYWRAICGALPPITSAVMRTVCLRPLKSWKRTSTGFIPARRTCCCMAGWESSTASGRTPSRASLCTVCPLLRAGTFLIRGYTLANHGKLRVASVVATSLSAPPSISTTWLLAGHKSAIRFTCCGSSTLWLLMSRTLRACTGWRASSRPANRAALSLLGVENMVFPFLLGGLE